MNHEIKGDMAERMLTALERIADALEAANANRTTKTGRGEVARRGAQ